MSKEVIFSDLELVDYKEAWDYQTRLFNKIIETKIQNRKIEDLDSQKKTTNHLIFCEHPHVYTIGKSGKENNLLLSQKGLKHKKISYYKINRGGDITYHGPGQIVGYPIFDLDHFFSDIHKYLRYIEEAIILTLAEYGLYAGRISGLTGVWLDHQDETKARKICALGVKCSRWVTMHGFAFNVNTDLSLFNHIIPCGINDKSVTSMQKELGKEVNIHQVKSKLLLNLANIFDFDIVKLKD